MTRAFVLSGGGSLGAWQVGQLRALLEAGVEPDLLMASSVGAMNAALIAEEPAPSGAARLADVWRRTEREHVLPRWGWPRLRALSRKALYPNDGVRRLVEDNISYRRLEDSVIPLHIVTTSLDTGRARVLSRGPVIETILASTAIPGIYPPVEIDGERLVDGGLASNVPVDPAVEAGADEVYVLAASSECPPAERPEHLHDVLLFSAGLLLRPTTELAACYAESARVVVLPSSCPIAVGPFDFSKTEALLEESYRQTAAFVAAEVPAA